MLTVNFIVQFTLTNYSSIVTIFINMTFFFILTIIEKKVYNIVWFCSSVYWQHYSFNSADTSIVHEYVKSIIIFSIMIMRTFYVRVYIRDLFIWLKNNYGSTGNLFVKWHTHFNWYKGSFDQFLTTAHQEKLFFGIRKSEVISISDSSK